MRSRLFVVLSLPLSLSLSGGLTLGLAGCENTGPKSDAPIKLAGGAVITSSEIKDGYDAYMQYCRPCHGTDGDGKGFSSQGLRPPPRDFTQGMFKFSGVPAPGLPPDAELKRIVKSGLHGTGMLPWDITDQELDVTLKYIKTFSPRWQTDPIGVPVAGVDPNFQGAKKAEVIELGRKLYHAKAQCSASCHANYVTHSELFDLAKAQSGNEMTEFAADMYVSKLKDSEYCLEWKPGWKKLEDRECAKPVKVMPPDFTRDDVRAGSTPADLFRTIGSGIGGAGMPPWKGALTDDEIWALSYYIRSLVEIRDTPASTALHARLDDPANLAWLPPPKAPPPAPEGTPPAAPEGTKPGDAAPVKPAAPKKAAAPTTRKHG